MKRHHRRRTSHLATFIFGHVSSLTLRRGRQFQAGGSTGHSPTYCPRVVFPLRLHCSACYPEQARGGDRVGGSGVGGGGAVF